jgi:hypothetical protein
MFCIYKAQTQFYLDFVPLIKSNYCVVSCLTKGNKIKQPNFASFLTTKNPNDTAKSD